jgi:signal transduction histidine kinase
MARRRATVANAPSRSREGRVRLSFRALTEGAGDPILVATPATGAVLFANTSFLECSGYARSEVPRLRLGKLLSHPLHEGRALLSWLRGHPLVQDNEAYLRCRNGETLPVSLTSARVGRPAARGLLQVTLRDTTRERIVLRELRQARDTLAALNLAGAHLMLETEEEGILGVIARELLKLGFHSAVLWWASGSPTPDPLLRFAFTSFSPSLQRAVERLLGHALSDLRIDPARTSLVRQVIESRRTLNTDRLRMVARELFGPLGESQFERLARLLGLRHLVLAPLVTGTGASGILVTGATRPRQRDPEAVDAFAAQASIALEKARLISELRRQQARLESEVGRRTRDLTLAVEALQEADRRKDNFLANVSHELRTPLVTVLGYTDLLVSGKLGALDPRQAQALVVTSASAKRLRGFIDELLDYSRHELTKDRLARAPFAVADVLWQAVVALAPRFAERGLRVRVRVSRGIPQVFGDKGRILQVMTNLLANAEHACSEGGRIRVAAARSRPGWLALAVADNGSGISQEHLQHIFDRLYQAGDASAQRDKSTGLGLGLAIARAIIEAHGGEISVRSRVARGTVFRFSLPTADPEPVEQ